MPEFETPAEGGPDIPPEGSSLMGGDFEGYYSLTDEPMPVVRAGDRDAPDEADL